MKQIIVSVLVLFAQLSLVQAQTMKEKLNAKKSELLGGEKEEEGAAISTEASHQFDEVEKFLTASKVYKITQRAGGSFYHDKWNGEFEVMEKNMTKVERTDGKVTSFSCYAGGLKSEESSAPLYYTNKNQSEFMVFVNGRGFHVQGLKPDGSIYKVVGIYSISKDDAKACTKWGPNFVQTEIANYYAQVKPLHDAAADALQTQLDNAAAEKRAKNTIVDKEVVSLSVQSGSNGKAKQGSTYSVVIVATLKDGTKISTADGGFSDEYTISATGLPATYKDPANFSMERSTVGESTITVPDVAVVSGDNIAITVVAKHNPKLTATTTLTMDYSEKVDLLYNAEMRSDRVVVVGGDLRIELKKVKHAVSGESLLEYKVFNTYNGKNELLKHFRVKQSESVFASVNGQKGWGAMSSTPAMNGTNGGNVQVIVDPSVDSYTLNISNKGGQGGAAGSGYPAGISGQEGKVETLKQKVNW